MITKLDKALKRQIEVANKPYVVMIDPERLLLTGKGRRKGITLQWKDLLSGEAALATALNASLAAFTEPAKRRSGAAKNGISAGAKRRSHAVEVRRRHSVGGPAKRGPAERGQEQRRRARRDRRS